ncbi:MAG TPA: hypothetical protein VGN63_01070 [Flavisolibacter sp.]|jgi:cellobiose-specific phosphotransferase system component IIA|nr:hypothetical protein [Flavisolibacter sp.]
MKKTFFALFVAGLFASCSNSGSAEQRVKDSLDSIKNLKVESVQEAASEAIDTIEQRHDSLNRVVDSVGSAVREGQNN